MAMESLIRTRRIRKHPLFIFLMAVLVSVVSLVFAYVLFPSYSSVLSIAFITMGLIPIVYRVIVLEEEEESRSKKSFTTFFARHFGVIQMFVWIFVGVILTFAFAYALMPNGTRVEMFSEQIRTFCVISGDCQSNIPASVTGRIASFAFEACGSESSTLGSCSLFIFENNAGVMILTIFLSLFYGAGAIFIIAWNASVIGVFFGEMMLVGNIPQALGMAQGMIIGHGPSELMSYIFAALVGAILSALVAKTKLAPHEFAKIVEDTAFLIVLALFSVGYGAVLEAAGIMGMETLYVFGGFFYVLALVLAVVLYGKRPSPVEIKSNFSRKAFKREKE